MRIMVFAFLILIESMICPVTWAAAVLPDQDSIQQFEIEEKTEKLFWDNQYLLSFDCAVKNPHCLSRQKIESIFPGREEIISHQGGANPGVVACELAGGRSVVGLSLPDHAETRFCKFKDNSILLAANLFKHSSAAETPEKPAKKSKKKSDQK